MSAKYLFKVEYDVKNQKYGGFLTTETVRFPTLQSAVLFAKQMKGLKNDKIQVVGLPVIERIVK